MFAFEACTYDFFIVGGFGAFLLLDGTTTLGGRGGVLMTTGIDETVGVDTNGIGFSFGISALGFNEPKIAFFLNKGAKLVLIHFLMVSAFSLSNKRTFYFKTKTVSKKFQRFLMTGTKSLLITSLPTG